MAKEDKPSEDKPGYYDDPPEGYPGHVQLPAPTMLPHFTAYWEVAIKPLGDLRPIDWGYWQGPLDGVILLIVDYGEWAIDKVPLGEVKQGNIPLPLVGWLLGIGREYILPQLDPKLRAVVSTVI